MLFALSVGGCAGRVAPSTVPVATPDTNAVATRVDSAVVTQAAPDSQPAKTTRPATTKSVGRFYVERSYGSDAQFNPLTVIVNEGWDMFRLVDEREVFNQPYSQSWRTVWKSLVSPAATVKSYGTWRWLRNEVFPITFGGKGGQWEPNYHLHLFGSGMTYIRTAEWYEQHDVPHPKIASAITLFVGHGINEVLENFGHTGYDEDGMTDLLIFDPAGMLLWNTDWMQRKFSGGRIEMTDWYGQPVLSQPDNRLENTFSAFMVRVPLPRTDNWKLITTGGNAFLFGVSRRIGNEHWLSFTGGAIPTGVPVIDDKTNTRTVTLAPNGGVFFDRNGSLLASFTGKSGITNGMTLNVYPGIVGSGRWSPGFYVQQAHGGVDGHGIRFGVTSSLGFGLGAVSRIPIRR
ncbi:MAG TPA: hypothetical protein VGM82_08870 [Gemmatimonadaceae bacterium]|jgi:hypothetical protein